MRIGFDYGGVLNSTSNRKGLMKLAFLLHASGHEIHIISWCSKDEELKFQQELVVESCMPPVAKFHGVRFTNSDPPGLRVDNLAGMRKREVMEREGIELLFDDNPFVCDEVRKLFSAIQVVP